MDYELIYLMLIFSCCYAQDYDVSDIQCSFSSHSTNSVDSITAKLKRPSGFKGHPLFADDRSVKPESDPTCAIKPDASDSSELGYDLKVIDFTRCGVLKRNGFVHVRIWFPQFPGVVMHSDQELIIMCKPPEPTVIQNKAAGFAGSFPHGARVSGVVEETPGRLEYEVALYKEAPPLARNTNNDLYALKSQNNTFERAAINQNELPVDQAVPIGTKLQLRARISLQSVWKYVKLTEVTVSPDSDDPHATGAISLVKDGCKNRDFALIIPHQPARYRDRPNEVFLDFEAFLLSSMKDRSTLWIHSQIKACMDVSDCQPDFCLDLFEPSGHGRKKRTLSNKNSTEYTKFKENIEYTVVMPEAFIDTSSVDLNQCKNFIFLTVLLAILLACSTITTCGFLFKVQTNRRKMVDGIDSITKGYSGRAVLQ